MQEPKIIESAEKNLFGLRLTMSFVDDRTSELWQNFGSRVGGIQGRIGTDRYSVKVYDANYSFKEFDPAASFDKWAAVEASDQESLAEGFESLIIPTGKYAVFIHRGTPAKAPETYTYIFGKWLPNSEYELDLRPHFEVLGEDYSPFDDDAEESICIPIKVRGENL